MRSRLWPTDSAFDPDSPMSGRSVRSPQVDPVALSRLVVILNVGNGATPGAAS